MSVVDPVMWIGDQNGHGLDGGSESGRIILTKINQPLPIPIPKYPTLGSSHPTMAGATGPSISSRQDYGASATGEMKFTIPLLDRARAMLIQGLYLKFVNGKRDPFQFYNSFNVYLLVWTDFELTHWTRKQVQSDRLSAKIEAVVKSIIS